MSRTQTVSYRSRRGYTLSNFNLMPLFAVERLVLLMLRSLGYAVHGCKRKNNDDNDDYAKPPL
jgi:hypothetical protein